MKVSNTQDRKKNSTMKHKMFSAIASGLLLLACANTADAWHVTITASPATPGDTANNPMVICTGGHAHVDLTATLWNDTTSKLPNQDTNITKECDVSDPVWTWTAVDGSNGASAQLDFTAHTSENRHVTAKAEFTITPKHPGYTGCHSPNSNTGTKNEYITGITLTAGEWTTVVEPSFTFPTNPGAPYTQTIITNGIWEPSRTTVVKKGNFVYTQDYVTVGGAWVADCHETFSHAEEYSAGISGSYTVHGVTLTGSATHTNTRTVTFGGDSKRYRWTWIAPMWDVSDHPTSQTTQISYQNPDGITWTNNPATNDNIDDPSDIYSEVLDGADFRQEQACCGT